MVKPLHDHSAAFSESDPDYDKIMASYQGNRLSYADDSPIAPPISKERVAPGDTLDRAVRGRRGNGSSLHQQLKTTIGHTPVTMPMMTDEANDEGGLPFPLSAALDEPPNFTPKTNPYERELRSNNMNNDTLAAANLAQNEDEVLAIDPREAPIMLQLVIRERDTANTKLSAAQARIMMYENYIKDLQAENSKLKEDMAKLANMRDEARPTSEQLSAPVSE